MENSEGFIYELVLRKTHRPDHAEYSVVIIFPMGHRECLHTLVYIDSTMMWDKWDVPSPGWFPDVLQDPVYKDFIRSCENALVVRSVLSS